MIDPKFFDEIARQLSEAIPPGLREFQKEIEQNFHSILQAAFAKLDLVTREELDTQTRVLARTRAKLEALEKQLAALEEQVYEKSAGDKTSHKPDKKQKHESED